MGRLCNISADSEEQAFPCREPGGAVVKCSQCFRCYASFPTCNLGQGTSPTELSRFLICKRKLN